MLPDLQGVPPISANISMDTGVRAQSIILMSCLSSRIAQLPGLFPSTWEQLGPQQRRGEAIAWISNLEALLRALLLHVGCGWPSRETAVRAKLAGLAELSDIRLLNRLARIQLSKAFLSAYAEYPVCKPFPSRRPVEQQARCQTSQLCKLAVLCQGDDRRSILALRFIPASTYVQTSLCYRSP